MTSISMANVKSEIARVFLHIAYGVDMHHQGHKGHHQHHGSGQSIHQKAHFKAHPAASEPSVNRTIKHMTLRRIQPDQYRQSKRTSHPQYGEDMCRRFGQLSPKQPHDSRSDKWQQRNQQIDFLHVCHILFFWLG
jgi:hypothetical protein